MCPLLAPVGRHLLSWQLEHHFGRRWTAPLAPGAQRLKRTAIKPRWLSNGLKFTVSIPSITEDNVSKKYYRGSELPEHLYRNWFTSSCTQLNHPRLCSTHINSFSRAVSRKIKSQILTHRNISALLILRKLFKRTVLKLGLLIHWLPSLSQNFLQRFLNGANCLTWDKSCITGSYWFIGRYKYSHSGFCYHGRSVWYYSQH